MKVEIKCTSGTAELHRARNQGQTITPADGGIEVEVLAVPKNVPSAQDWIKANAANAWNTVGVGQKGRESGKVSVTALDGAVVVREYLDVNPFTSPDATDHTDHTLRVGETIERNVIGANAETLLVVGPA